MKCTGDTRHEDQRRRRDGLVHVGKYCLGDGNGDHDGTRPVGLILSGGGRSSEAIAWPSPMAGPLYESLEGK